MLVLKFILRRTGLKYTVKAFACMYVCNYSKSKLTPYKAIIISQFDVIVDVLYVIKTSLLQNVSSHKKFGSFPADKQLFTANKLNIFFCTVNDKVLHLVHVQWIH